MNADADLRKLLRTITTVLPDIAVRACILRAWLTKVGAPPGAHDEVGVMATAAARHLAGLTADARKDVGKLWGAAHAEAARTRRAEAGAEFIARGGAAEPAGDAHDDDDEGDIDHDFAGAVEAGKTEDLSLYVPAHRDNIANWPAMLVDEMTCHVAAEQRRLHYLGPAPPRTFSGRAGDYANRALEDLSRLAVQFPDLCTNPIFKSATDRLFALMIDRHAFMRSGDQQMQDAVADQLRMRHELPMARRAQAAAAAAMTVEATAIRLSNLKRDRRPPSDDESDEQRERGDKRGGKRRGGGAKNRGNFRGGKRRSK